MRFLRWSTAAPSGGVAQAVPDTCTVTPGGVAALWGARDPNGTFYLYDEHVLWDPEPTQNAIGDRIDGWRVCWIGGWDKCRVLFVVMVERQTT